MKTRPVDPAHKADPPSTPHADRPPARSGGGEPPGSPHEPPFTSGDESFLSFALSTARIGAWELDLDTHVARRSLFHDQIFGYPELLPQWTYETFLAHVIPGDREEVDRKFREAVASRSNWNFECRIARHDGEERWIWAAGRHLPAEGGRGMRMAGIVQDITDRKRAAEALSASEQNYRELVRHAPAAIYEVDFRTQRFISVNDAMCEMTGYSRDELLGMDPFDLLDDRSAVLFRRRIDQWLSGNTPDPNVEYMARVKDGRKIHVILSVTFRSDAAGRPVGASVIGYDITERKRMEEALRDSEERWRMLGALTNEGIMILRSDGIALDVNEQFARMHGYEPAELLGKPIDDLIAPEHRDRVYSNAASGRDVLMEQRDLRKDGTPIFVEVRAHSITYNGNAARVAVLRDVTERKRVEEALRKSEEQVRSDLDAMTRLQRIGSLFLHEGDLEPVLGEILDAAITISGADFGDVQMLDPISAELRIVAHRGFPEWWVEYWRTVGGDRGSCGNALGRGERVIVEDVLESPLFGRTGDLEMQLRAGVRAMQSTPLLSRSGRPLGVFSTHYRRAGRPGERTLRLLDLLARQAADIIERAQTEEALRTANRQLVEADRRKNEFLATLSHELRNPLAPITNSLYVLEQAAAGGEAAQHAQAIIDRQVRQLTRIVDDLLDVTRIARNKIRLQRARLDLNELVRRTIEDHRSLFEDREITLDFTPGPGPVHVHGDGSRLGQSFGNLLQNAAKFTAPGGRVSVSLTTEPSANRAVLRVADTGVGMTPQMLSHLFEPFMQADTTLDRNKGGLGLGLALVKGIVELHGGEVYAYSAGLGRGAEFVMRLPLDLTEPAPGDVVRGAPAAPRRRRVLIIEDNVDAAESLRLLLSFSGHDVLVAYDGPTGIAEARTFDPDLLLCDIGLPVMDGYDVARAFRADAALRDTFLVALTGYALPEDLQRASDAGFDRHVAKPPSLEKIEEILSEVPARRNG